MGSSENGFNGYQRFERIESAVERLSTAVLTMAEQMHAMASHGHTVNEMMGKLADAQLRLSQTQSRLADAQLKLAEALSHTEERLGSLMMLINELLRRMPQPDPARARRRALSRRSREIRRMSPGIKAQHQEATAMSVRSSGISISICVPRPGWVSIHMR